MRLLGIIVSVAILSGWFYWFHYRPEEIRSACATESGMRVEKDLSGTDAKGFERIRLDNELLEAYYKLCVRSKGLPN